MLLTKNSERSKEQGSLICFLSSLEYESDFSCLMQNATQEINLNSQRRDVAGLEHGKHHKKTYWEHFHQRRELTLELHINITSKILEAVLGQCSELLASLVSLRVVVIAHGQEGY